MSWPLAAASQKGFVSGLIGGAGITRSLVAMASLPLHDDGGAAMPGAEGAPGPVGERQPAALHLHLRVRLAAELADGLDDLRQPAPVRGMVVAETAAVRVEGKLPRPRDEIAVGHQLAALALDGKAQVLELHEHGDREA